MGSLQRRVARRNPSTRASSLPFRRKMQFQPLEPRLLLSSDPLGALTNGILSVRLTDAAESVVMTQLAGGVDGGVTIDLQVNGVTERYTGVQGISVNAEGGDDTLRFVDVTVALQVSGGAGNDTIVGSNSDNAWRITGTNAGMLNGIQFTEIENLTGGKGNDSFAVETEEGLRGVIAGEGGVEEPGSAHRRKCREGSHGIL